MARIHLIIPLAIFVIANQVLFSNSNPLMIGAIGNVLDIYEMVTGITGAISSLQPAEKPEFYIQVSEQLQSISRELSSFREEYRLNSELMQEALIRKFQVHGEFHDALTTLQNSYFNVIKSRYDRFDELQLRSNNSATINLTDKFFREITGESESGLDFKLKMMYRHVTGPHKADNLFNLMRRQLQEVELDRCNDPVSSQEYIYNLFTDIVTHELDAFTMIVAGYSYLLNQTASEEYEAGMNITIDGTQNRLIGYTREAQEVMAVTSRFIFRCGGADSIEVKGLSQAIVIDERKWNACQGRQHCVPKGHQPAGTNSCGNKCLGQPCYSGMTNCQTLSHMVTVCEPEGNSNRRYNYLKYSDSTGDAYCGKKIEGSNEKCNREIADLVGWGQAVDRCRFCLCTCTDNGWGATDVRTLIHWGENADTSDNKAIVGVKFVEKDGMIHLQIKQGTLLPYGKIVNGSEEWKPIRKIQRVLSTNPQVEPEFWDVEKNTKLKLFHDYYHITQRWKTVSLADVQVPNGYIVTGVGFIPGLETKLGSGETNPFEIILGAKPYDAKTGKYVIADDKPEIIIAPSDEYTYKGGNRVAITFDEPGLPTDATRIKAYPGSDKIVTFDITDYKKDAGQTMIPFFDGQAVETQPSTPLTGVGLYFKGQSGYAGFIAPRILTFDFNDKIDKDYEKLEISSNSGNIHG